MATDSFDTLVVKGLIILGFVFAGLVAYAGFMDRKDDEFEAGAFVIGAFFLVIVVPLCLCVVGLMFKFLIS